MSRFRLLVAAAAMAVSVLPAHVPTALAASPSPAPGPSTSASTDQQLAQLNAQLTADQAKLTDLNNQVEQAQGKADLIGRKLNDDKQREAALTKELTSMGRLEYEQPTFRLTSILAATSLQQLYANIAQARLVANKEGNLLSQARDLRRQDEQAREQIAAQLASVQAARDQAGQVAAATLAMRNSVLDQAAQSRASTVVAQAQAVQTIPNPGAGPFPNHFSFGYCTWYVANRRPIPWFGNAIEWWPNARAYGYPEGQAPRVGAVLVTAESGLGHVAYVESVSGNTFVVSEMNFTAWDVVDRRTITLGGGVPIVGFIYG